MGKLVNILIILAFLCFWIILVGAVYGYTIVWVVGLVLLIAFFGLAYLIKRHIDKKTPKTTWSELSGKEKRLLSQEPSQKTYAKLKRNGVNVEMVLKNCLDILKQEDPLGYYESPYYKGKKLRQNTGSNVKTDNLKEETKPRELSREKACEQNKDDDINKFLKECLGESYVDVEEYVDAIYDMWSIQAYSVAEKTQFGDTAYCVLHIQSDYLWDIIAEVTYDFIKIYALFFKADTSKEGLFEQINKWNQSNKREGDCKFVIVDDNCLVVKNIPIMSKSEVARMSWAYALKISNTLDNLFSSASSFIKR